MLLRILCLLLGFITPLAAAAEVEALRQPGAVALMRHATAPGTGDPSGFRLGDCSTQRNLSDEGRAEARAIGARLTAEGIGFSHVFTSEWCRTRETAELLALGPVTPLPAANSFFANRGRAAEQTEALRARLAALPEGSRAIVVTHQVNITALTGVFPRSGEIVVVVPDGEGGLAVTGRVPAP